MDKWELWELFDSTKALIELPDIKEPPCKNCKFFSPRAITNNFGFYDGVKICIVDKMYHDFSCYKKLCNDD